MKMERKRGPEITSWLYNNGVPLNMKKMIMTCVLRELEANQDVNIENILSILPLESLKFIKRHLCLDTLKKVPVLQSMDEQVLTAVCDGHLKPVIYSENSYIIREREPIDKMLFITQGVVRTYTTSNDGSGFSRTVCLEKGDFYGEELLKWALNNVTSSSDDLPISNRIAKCSTKVEAFTFRASDLKSVVSEFWTDVIEDNPHPTEM